MLCLLLLTALLPGCRQARNETRHPVASVAETALLLDYLEQNGNLINGPFLPALIGPEEVYGRLQASNMLVIDLRTPEAFSRGHIPLSVNVRPDAILDYFEQQIDPPAFGQIVLVCNNAMLSGYVNAILLFLGYDNVLSLRNGLSSWDMDIASNYWLKAMSDSLEGRLETTPHPKAPAAELPAIATGESSGYRILRARAREVLSIQAADINVPVTRLLENPEAYYIVNYWPQALYESGHLPGAVQYAPKYSLHSSTYLNTLPAGKPLVVYCFTGHHSAYVTGFLRLLGYQAYNLPYGANSFIHSTMLSTQADSRSFTSESVAGYPLSTPEAPAQPTSGESQETLAPPIPGGC